MPTASSTDLHRIVNLLRAHPLVGSDCTDNVYELDEILGEGGFGIAFLGVERNSERRVCVKLTTDQDSWHREAYFGSLLRGNSRVIQMLESFPYHAQIGRHGFPSFVLVFEYAENGSLGDYLEKKGPWPEDRARREIAALLKVMTELHAGGAMHRDITPMNVLVTKAGNLKLNDFGIAQQELLGKAVPADVFNWGFVSHIKQQAGRRHWLTSDDVFQMGQLLGIVLRGDPSELLGARQIKKLNCSDELKAIISKAVGPRKERFETAYEMLLALEGQDVEQPAIRTLKNRRVVFTGPLSVRREDAAMLVAQVGGTVQGEVRGNTDVVVVGQRSKLYRHKMKGKKIKTAQELNRSGSKIRFINEPQFLRLVRYR